MNHAACYDRLMARARGRKLNVYFETHHVHPRSLGGSDDPENLVDLTYREHFLAHWLLVKICVGAERGKMVQALHCMTMPLKSRREVVTGWRFELLKRLVCDEWMRSGAMCRERKALLRRFRLAEAKSRAKDNSLARTVMDKAIVADWVERHGMLVPPTPPKIKPTMDMHGRLRHIKYQKRRPRQRLSRLLRRERAMVLAAMSNA